VENAIITFKVDAGKHIRALLDIPHLFLLKIGAVIYTDLDAILLLSLTELK
jgi:hypothetical protein